MEKLTGGQMVQIEEIQERIMCAIIDILDSSDTKICEAIAGLEDPAPADETDLHERMAKAAIQVYVETVQSVKVKA